jgi:HEXXH motif-containing protein
LLQSSYQLLAEVEVTTPPVVPGLLGAPQFGAWANDALNRLLGEPVDDGEAPLEAGLYRLALFAATAAIRARHPFSLMVPLSGGTASFPAIGTIHLGEDARAGDWGLASSDGPGWTVRRGLEAAVVPAGNTRAAGWTPLPRITVTERGLCLDIVLDHDDPFLDRYGIPRRRVTEPDVPRWRELLERGWQILARGHPELAVIVAEIVLTLVPLAPYGPGRPASATEETSFGAIALSLPSDDLAMAEVLVHESHHAVLSALTDIEPLLRHDAGGHPFLGYAPWRDDPRPAHALLQGIYAHYGMGQFWRRQYLSGPPADRERAAVEFGRMRAMTARAISTLAGSGLLTAAGQELLADISRDVAAWLTEPLPDAVTRRVAARVADHEARWRVRWGAGILPGSATQ